LSTDNHNLITLETFTEKDFETFKSWITDEEELALFAGPIFSFPIKDIELIAYLNRPEIKPFKVILQETGETIGHCELNFGHELPRLSRILVGDQSLRGKGIGEQIVIEMAKILFQDNSITKIDLNVFDFNKSAIRCYEKVGFEINPIPTLNLSVNGKTWKRLNMILSKVDFSK
jgi:RimJ/RimL family protein N-acetyltransferase